MMQQHADLWDVNPQTGRLYTVRERREMLRQRGFDNQALGGGQSTDAWDNWFDQVAESNLEATGKTPAELNTRFAGGPAPQDSNQLRGLPVGVSALQQLVRKPRQSKGY